LNGRPIACKTKWPEDVRIDVFDGGYLLDPLTPDGRYLADVWKGCTQASSHATNAYNHPSVDDRTVIPKALKIVLDHLQNTIYNKASKHIRDYVLERVP
jgi:hypothetical protein